MRTLNKLLFVIAIALLAASITQSMSIDFKPAVRVLLSKDTQVTLGKGNTPNDLPVAECAKSQNSAQLNCTISVRLTDRSNDQCNFVLSAGNEVASVKLDSLYQLSEKKLIVVWSVLSKEIKRKITAIDFDNCSNTVTLNFSKNNRRELEDIILYGDAFEALVTTKYPQKFIIRYDLEGRELETIPYDKDPSKYQRTIKDIKDVITLAEVKSEFQNQVTVSARSSQFLTVCGQKSEKYPEIFGCRQVYVPNHLENRMQVVLDKSVKIIAVYDFKNGGVALFGIQDDSKLVVAEMRPNEQSKVQSYKLRWPVNEDVSVILNFNEKDGSFTFVGEINEVEHAVVMLHLDLPSKIQQDSHNAIDH